MKKAVVDQNFNFLPSRKCMLQTNWLRNSSTVVYLTSGYSCVASTPNDGSISKLVWSPFTNAEWEIDNIMFIGSGASARTNKTQLIYIPKFLVQISHYVNELGMIKKVCYLTYQEHILASPN